MKIIAIEHEMPGARAEQFEPHLQAEARHVWDLYQSGLIREAYFRADRSEAVLILECPTFDDASLALDSLPLVQAGLIRFELIPLSPYPGFARLFRQSEDK